MNMAEIIISDGLGGSGGFPYNVESISCVKELCIDDRLSWRG